MPDTIVAPTTPPADVTITGTVPDYSQASDVFAVNAESTMKQLPAVFSKINAVLAWFFSTAAEVFSNATIAKDSAAGAASAANYKGEWSGLSGSFTQPGSVGHLGSTWLFNNDIAAIETEEPSATNANYHKLSGAAGGPVITESATISVDTIANVLATSAAVNLTLPVTIAGSIVVVHNSLDSTEVVTLLNPVHTIKKVTGPIAIDDNLIITPGQTLRLLANSDTVLEVMSEESSQLTYPMTELVTKTASDEVSDDIPITLDCSSTMFWRFDFGQSPLMSSSGSVDFTIAGLPSDPTVGFTGHIYMLGQGRKDISFTAAGWTAEWDGGVSPEFGSAATDKDTIIFYLEPDTSTIVLSVMRGKHA